MSVPSTIFSLESSGTETVQPFSPVYYYTQSKDSVLAQQDGLPVPVSAEHETSVALLARGRVWDSKHLICLLFFPAPLSSSLLGQPRQEQLLLHPWGP